ncbi:MAG: [FeFe] hydrogenase, group A [Coriobacteriales bacterium]|jgi:NADH-quinone oxidoreductase subunit G|nr:[FeFe] hydrogenase, group A [Coriobacteriales bacterium]
MVKHVDKGLKGIPGTAFEAANEAAQATGAAQAAFVTLTVDDREVSVHENTTILDAAHKAGIEIPTLCYLREVNEVGSCRVCVVELAGENQLVAACNNVVRDGMEVRTNSPLARRARKLNVELLLSQHDVQCTSCVRSGNCTLQALSNDLNILDARFEKNVRTAAWEKSFPLIRDEGKCVKCLRCVNVCEKVQACAIWDVRGRATRSTIGVKGALPIEESNCALCGQCIVNCPTGALRTRDDTDRVLEALADPDKVCVVQIAPAVRAAWGESLGLSHEQATVKRLVAALRTMGFDYIFDTDFSADLTIMEEGSEFLERLGTGAGDGTAFPMFTSCCPGWVRYLKGHHPELIDQLSSAKSPQQMFGAVMKSYHAENIGVDPERIFSISIMPCVAKKHECAIPCMDDAGAGPDVDVVLTTREAVRLIRAGHVNVHALEEEEFDQPLGIGTGAGVIFGVTGGVMEAALRSAHFLVTGSNPDPDAFAEVRGLYGWKEATFNLAGTELKVAVASGLANTERLLDALARGEVSYHFVEIMACPGGCANGGGQTISENAAKVSTRSRVIYGLDAHSDLRFSHENPAVAACYADYLEKPLSERAHHLLHTDHRAWSMPHEK